MKRKTEGSGGKRWLDMIERLTEGRAGGREIVAPNRVVNDGDVVQIGDTRFRIIHTGPAHSDNDLMIEIVGEDTLFTGDIVRNGLLGIMESDASFEGNIAAIDVITGKGYRHYIPGHGPAGGVEVAERYRTYLTRLLDTVRDLYDQGIADFEMKPRVIEAVADYRAWEGFDLRVGPHVSRAYLEVEADAF
jgi:glyoxylase-like metal-dependent hydrolase (beta-lactamase superfamily II)